MAAYGYPVVWAYGTLLLLLMGPVADDDAKCLNIDAGCGELRRLII